MTARVDTVPASLKPLLGMYGHSIGFGLYALYAIQRPTIRIDVAGSEQLQPDRPFIFALWHEAVLLALQWSVPRFPWPLNTCPQASMQHPLWYMKPIHVVLGYIGVERIVLGSTGYHGREAAGRLVEYLRAGYSTVLSPDGPAGPRRVLRHGILHLAAESGLAIVPLRLHAWPHVVLPTWDRKRIAVPFSRIRVEIGAPIVVSAEAPGSAEEDLIRELG